MSAVYIDTSALGRVLLWENDAALVLRALEEFDERISSRLLATELRRLALRHGLVNEANTLLEGVALRPLDEAILTAADELLPISVATLDAIHLATALRLADAGFVDAIMTYDERLTEGAREHGLDVLAPEAVDSS